MGTRLMRKNQLKPEQETTRKTQCTPRRHYQIQGSPRDSPIITICIPITAFHLNTPSRYLLYRCCALKRGVTHASLGGAKAGPPVPQAGAGEKGLRLSFWRLCASKNHWRARRNRGCASDGGLAVSLRYPRAREKYLRASGNGLRASKSHLRARKIRWRASQKQLHASRYHLRASKNHSCASEKDSRAGKKDLRAGFAGFEPRPRNARFDEKPASGGRRGWGSRSKPRPSRRSYRPGCGCAA